MRLRGRANISASTRPTSACGSITRTRRAEQERRAEEQQPAASPVPERTAGVVERLVPGVIPAAMVRTESGKTRRVRTIDLSPLANPARVPGKE